MRHVQDAAARGDERARLALDVFVHRLAKAVAGLVTSLERLDALVFSRRHRGEQRDRPPPGPGPPRLPRPSRDPEAKRRATAGRPGPDQPSRPRAQALVVPDRRGLMIARDTARLIRPRPGSRPFLGRGPCRRTVCLWSAIGC